jgi:phage recombination protein Bet
MKEAYCIKYGSQPATMVVGKDAYFKRADACPTYDGIESGLIVLNDAGIQYRQGAFYLPNDEEIVGAWAEAYRSDKAHPYRVEVSFSEYVGKKKDGTVNGQWASKPATMIVKVAEVQALRKAFPGTLGQLYVAEEKGVEEPAAEFSEVVQADQRPQEAIEAAETPTETPASPTETAEQSQGTFFA